MSALNTAIIKKSALCARDSLGKALDFLELAVAKLEPLGNFPLIGDTVKDAIDVTAMLNDYYHGRYKKLPFFVMLGCVGIVAYLLNPYDIIPDSIPIIGAVDDVFVIQFIVELCVGRELEKYREWREENAVILSAAESACEGSEV